MSSENAAPLLDEDSFSATSAEPTTSAEPATPAVSTAPAEPASPRQYDAATTLARPLTVQERRLQVARDINAKIDDLEREVAQLSGTFSHSRETVQTSLGELRQRSLEIMGDLMRVSARLEEGTRQQSEQRLALGDLDGRLLLSMTELDRSQQRATAELKEHIRHSTGALEQRFISSVSELGRELTTTNSLLGTQQQRLDQLRDAHETLVRLHDHLDRLTSRQAHALETLATDSRQQLQMLRTHIDGLNALYREQQAGLCALNDDHELLARKSDETAARLAGLDAVVTDNIGRTRLRFRAVAATIAALAVVSLGLIAWFQFFPSAVPETVKTQLAGLSTGLGQQQDSNQALRNDMQQGDAALAGEQADQRQKLKRQGRDVAGLKAEAARTARRLREVEARLGTLQAAQEGGVAGGATAKAP